MSNPEHADRQVPPPNEGEASPSGTDSASEVTAPLPTSPAPSDDTPHPAAGQFMRPAAPAVEGAVRWMRAWLLRAWDAARRARPATTPEELTGTAASLWRWAPVLAPLALEGLLLLLAISVAGHQIGHGATVARGHLRTLALVLLVVGVALSAVLYTARDIGTWIFALLLGVSGSLVATVFVLLGVKTGLVASALLLLAGVAFLRPHRVGEHTVQITLYMGRFHRTLLPGQHVLLPGEQILATLPTDQRRITALPPAAAALGGEAQATATLVYQFVPREAQRAALMGRDWEATLQQTVAQALRDELRAWRAAATGTGNGAAGDEASSGEQQLQRRLETRLRQAGAQWGLRVAHVELSDVVTPRGQAQPQGTDMAQIGEQLAELYLQSRSSPQRAAQPASQPQPPAGQAPSGRTTPEREPPRPATPPVPRGSSSDAPTAALNQADPARPDGSTSPPATSQPPRLLTRLAGFAAGWQGDGRRAAQRPGEADAGPTPAVGQAASQSKREGEGSAGRDGTDEQSGEDAAQRLSPEVLAAAYEAVREGRIGDPATIRQIADRFADLASTAEPDSELAFDPESAANILRQRAEELALARGDAPEDAREDAPAETGQTAPPPSISPHRPPPPRIERDDNVTSGG